MFKKGKKKSKDDSSKYECRPQIANSASEAVEFNSNSNAGADREQTAVDGFDENGFVDLKPERTATLVGPKQPCQYVGTFPVHLGMPNGEKTLETHKERTRFVKEKLVTYRNAKKGVAVLVVVSSDGIKVVSQDGKRVRMAHALQRISFATCDPDFRLFAYMTHDPSPTGVGIYCHVFMTTKLTQVRDLTSLIGKAFQRAFAAAKLPKEAEVMRSRIFDPVRDSTRPGKPRRWAKLEAHKSHEDSEHARVARARKVRSASKEGSGARQSPDAEVAMNDSVTDDRSRPSEETRTRAATEGEIKELQPQATSIALPDDVRAADGEKSSTDGSPLVKRKETPSSVPQERSKATPPEMRRFQVPATENTTNNQHLSRRTIYLVEEDEDSRLSSPDLPPPLPPQRAQNPPDPSADSTCATATTSDTRDSRRDVVEAALSSTASPISRTSSDPNLTRFENPTPPELPPKHHTIHSSLSDPSFDLQRLSLEQLPCPPSPSRHAAVDVAGGKTSEPLVRKMSAPEQNVARSHQDEYWYLADIPREFVIEMLENSEEGAFFVRDSQSRPGCCALTMRVPYEVNDTGYGNYLITQEGGVFMMQGFDRSFSDLPSLIEHHARVSDGLPCRLLLSGSNVLCEDEDYINMPSTDPDYIALSDYRDIYAELT